MEFWGAEVKSGEPLEVYPGDGFILHLSQACLGEVKKNIGNESVCLFVKVDKQKLVLGTLSSENFPQLSFDLVFEKKFELSHNWKNGSVYFTGYKACPPEQGEVSDSQEDFPVVTHDSGKYEPQAKPAAKPDVTAAKRVKIVEPNKDEDMDEDDVDKDASSNDDSSDEDNVNEAKAKVNAKEEFSEDDDSSDDEDSSEDEDEETPMKAKASKKRPLESAQKTPVPEKKAKLVTPENTEFIVADGKKGGGHVATPHPSKKAATKQQTPKSGAFPCNSCNRSFNSEIGLQSHTKAKHSEK
ncbi:histone deacetylase HDT3-like isoform X1 [Quercus lobata]|uniref:histone deacetylase HDT3-like isoform X1 n=1 Tax=Quercus lobata TaxID=97700 RepID=UPI001246ED35|nr:histone deacetylase HDT3-like isoform X1 [Quercus lobata]